MENNTITFDPQKSYKWEPTDKVVLTGEVFGALLSTIRSIDNTELSMMFKAVNSLNNVLHQVVKENVESGLFQEDIKTPDGVE